MNLWRFLLSVVLICVFIYPVVEGLDIADLEKALSEKDDSHKKPLLNLLSTALKKTKKADESKIDDEDKPRRDRKLHPLLDKLGKPKQESENKSNKNRASSNVHVKTGQSIKELTRQMVEKVLLEEKLKNLKEKFYKLKKKYRKLRQRRKHERSNGKHGLRKKIDHIIGILDQHHVTKKDRKLKHKLQKQIKHEKKARAEAKQEGKTTKKKPKAKAKKLAKKIKQEKKAQPEPKGKNSGRNVGEKIREAIKALVKPNKISKTQMEKLENELRKVKQNNKKETAKRPQHKHMGKKKIVKEEKKLKNQLVKDDNKLKKKLRDDKRKAKAEKKKVKAKNKEVKAENKEAKAEQKKVKAEKKKFKAEKKKVKAGKKKVKAEKKKIKAGKKNVKAKKQNKKPFIKIIQPNKNAKQGQPAAKLTKIREGQYPQK